MRQGASVRIQVPTARGLLTNVAGDKHWSINDGGDYAMHQDLKNEDVS
jgi:hypothetical protein